MGIHRVSGGDQGGRHELSPEAERLYELYAKPLEDEHWGELVAVNPDGRWMLVATVSDLLRDAAEAFGPGNHILRVGPRAASKWL